VSQSCTGLRPGSPDATHRNVSRLCRRSAIVAIESKMTEVHEARCRRALRRHGLRLEKCRERNWETASGSFGNYRIVRTRENTVIDGFAPYTYSLTLDELLVRCVDESYLAKLR